MTSLLLKLRSEHLPFVLVAFSFAGSSLASLESRASGPPPIHTPAVRRSDRSAHAFTWPGTYDVIGTRFSDGERYAVLTVTPRDTSYDLSLAGPPGSLRSLQIVGDSAHVAWDLGGPVMMIELRGSGDSLDGRWYVGEDTGLVYGTRRR